MRKILVLVFSSLFSVVFSLQAQTIDGVALKEIESTYIQLTGRGRLFSNTVRVEVDFGQDRSRGRVNDSQIIDQNGNVVLFNSMVDALNFFDRLGYEYVDSEHISEDSPIQYLLRKKRQEMDLANSPLRRD
ncbi:hypothetical protein SAMN04488104_100124 [Algoriphagus faecimaris]|uniref:Uncharacterized protein n=1 Tax=Algoriphagus faecimaris TaxID=686796 RepID=A0A1G6M7H1_9BACT|nr:hypothetical protein [Algoriphagus faecimaris]SDC50885.1 hypothetical protein SAMN04488104_100124 [Algoriphagus faecimaris]